MKKYRVVVPAGIGDFSWLWAKFSTIKDAEWEVFVPDCYPQRTKQYVDLLPNVKGIIGKHTYPDIITWGQSKLGKTWEQTVRNFGEGEFIYIQVNEHLGSGKRLEDWMPDLGVDYHYKFNQAILDKVPAIALPRPCIGISMASMRGIRAWNAWLPETWAEFFKLIAKDLPEVTFVLLGGTWDIDTALELVGILPSNVKVYDLVGKTTVPEAVNIVGSLNYFIGYSSGLNAIANVLHIPQTCLWPKHQYELMYSWPDPKDIDNRDYMGFCYDSAERIYNRVKPKLREVFNGDRGSKGNGGAV